MAETDNAKINFKLFGLLHSLVMTSLPKLEANELRNVSEIIEHILCSQFAVEDPQVSFKSTTRERYSNTLKPRMALESRRLKTNKSSQKKRLMTRNGSMMILNEARNQSESIFHMKNMLFNVDSF